MATPFREILDFFGQIGVFDVVLPFLLVFTVVFALLERTKVFGVEEIEGKKYTKKNLNSITAFVIAFLVVASSRLVEIITTVSSNFVVLLFGVVLFLLLVGSFFQEKEQAVFLEGGWKTAFMTIVFIVLAFIFLDAVNLLEDTFGFLSGSSKGEVVGSVILLILIVLFVVFVTQDRKAPKSESH
ncbi:hypothetical protein ISS07_01970 [Candidatus Woesearchaeota archaeon]|nr:hypothetical protein [Candidatus Woesearchaeota archaeon]